MILESVNKYLLALVKEQIKIAFDQAEKEVADLHQRTRESIQTARLDKIWYQIDHKEKCFN